MQKKENKKKLSPMQIISLVIFLLALEAPELAATVLSLVLVVGPIGLVIWLIRKNARNGQAGRDVRNITYARKTETLDDCPKPMLCFHKDKGEHHVQRGKEIDPWDRPDIDIRKYQRKE